MDPVIIVLRLAHVGAGVFWVGAAFTIFLFVEPTLKALGPETEKKFMQYVIKQRKLVKIVTASTFITVGAGAALFWIVSDGLNPVWLSSGFGIGISVGALAAIIAFVMGAAVIGPSFSQMEQTATEIERSGGPPTADQVARMSALGRRLQVVGIIDVVLLAIAVVFMAIARYL